MNKNTVNKNTARKRTTGKKTTLPDSEQKQVFVKDMFNRIAKRYDMMNTILTFGLDKYWRRKTLKILNELTATQNAHILDLACGTGDFIKNIQKQNSKQNRETQITGVDFSQQMLEVAKTRTNIKPAKNSTKKTSKNKSGNSSKSEIQLICADITSMPIADKSFDGAVMGFALRNLVDIPAALQEVSRTLKPNAPLCLLEVGIPKNRIIKILHSFYFARLVPFVGRLLSDSTAYKYLPQSVAFLPTPNALKTALKSAGFSKIKHNPLSGNIATLTTAIKK